MTFRIAGVAGSVLLASAFTVWAQPPADPESMREVQRLRKAVADARRQTETIGQRLAPIQSDIRKLADKLKEIEPAKLRAEAIEKVEVVVQPAAPGAVPATPKKAKTDEPQKWELPLAREGKKDQNLLIICRNNRAFILDLGALVDAADKDNAVLKNGGRLRLAKGDNDVLVTHKKIGAATYLDLKCVLKDGHAGEPIESVLDDASPAMKQFGDLDPSKNTVQFTVFPDSYEVFKKLRAHAYAKGFDVAWSPMSVDQDVMLTSGRALPQ
jgi:hypothetical protein